MKKLIIALTLICTTALIFGQGNVGVGTTNPEEMAILDISSSDKGLLIPRAETSDIEAAAGSLPIPNGLLVFQPSDNTFYYYNSGNWKAIGKAPSVLIDEDMDTEIKLVENFQDRIEYYLDGVEHFQMRKNVNGTVRLNILNNNKNIGIGKALVNNTTGIYNVAIGDDALRNNLDGNSNTAVGTEVLLNNTSGFSNTGIGYEALYNNNGNSNTAIGYQSAVFNSTGIQNTALGYFSLYNNSIGFGNVAIGYGAGANEMGSNKLYIENSFADSSEALIYGEFDTNLLRVNGELQVNDPAGANGYVLPTNQGSTNQFLKTNADGTTEWNEVVGRSLADTDNDTKVSVESSADSDNVTIDLAGTTKYLLEQNQHGITTLKFKNNNFNTLVGDGAGKELQSSGSGSNTIVGRFAGAQITSGDRNVFLGGGAGDKNNGSRNVMVGTNSGADNAIGTDNVFLGHRAGINTQGSNKLYIENSSADSSQALIYGEFNTNLLRVNGELQVNDPAGANGYSLPTTRGFPAQFLKTNADGTTEWGNDESFIINFGDLQGNQLKLYQDIQGLDTFMVDLTGIQAETLEFSNGEEVNTGVAIRYFIYVNNSGDFPSPVSNNPHNVIGELKLFAGSQADLGGWLPCEGQVLNIADYLTLFTIIGTTYGGDGMTTFKLPDMRNAIPVHN